MEPENQLSNPVVNRLSVDFTFFGIGNCIDSPPNLKSEIMKRLLVCSLLVYALGIARGQDLIGRPTV